MLYNYGEEQDREELIEEFREILDELTQNLEIDTAAFPYDFNDEVEKSVRECVVHLAYEYRSVPTEIILMATMLLLERYPNLNIDLLFTGTKN